MMQRLGRLPDPRSRALLRNKRLVEERSDFPDSSPARSPA
jgi:hypothetical protein